MWQRLKAKLRGWRTVIFGSAVFFASSALELLSFLQTIDLNTFMSPRTATLLGMGVGVSIIVLRLVTTGPVGAKPEDE